MKHVKYADKALLVGDDVADTLLEYARMVADNDRAETVTLSVISPDGNIVEAAFLLTSSTEIMIESTSTRLEAPDNEGAVRKMRERINANDRSAVPESEPPWTGEDADAAR